MSAARSACRINGKEGSQENAATAAHGAESARIVKAGSASTEVIENAGIVDTQFGRVQTDLEHAGETSKERDDLLLRNVA